MQSSSVPSVRRLGQLAGHVAAVAPLRAQPVLADGRVVEMRIYYAPDAVKLEALHTRIANHGLSLVERHGIQNLGHFVPVDNPEHKLVFFLGYPSQADAKAMWSAFLADEEWLEVKAASEPDGGLVARVENQFMGITDYSPLVGRSSQHGGVFELRTYTSEAERLLALHARFRDHTLGLFDKHGMTNIAYFAPFTPLVQSFPPVDPPAADTVQGQLVYMLQHESQSQAKESFDSFLKDFVPIMKASEEAAGGGLTIDGGVQSEFLIATDYSAVR